MIKVCHKKYKLQLRLTARGTDKAEAQAVSDLDVPDPELDKGKQIIQEAMGEIEEDDSKPEDS